MLEPNAEPVAAESDTIDDSRPGAQAEAADRKLLRALIKGILLGIGASGFAYAMWEMFTRMNPSAQESQYQLIKREVDGRAKDEIERFTKSIRDRRLKPERVYGNFYSYIFHYVYRLDSWQRHYY